MNKALFLDVDGTIIQTKSGNKFAKNKDDWKFNKNILEKIKYYFHDLGFDKIIMISNQAGIARGFPKLGDVEYKFINIRDEINEKCNLDGNILFYFCPKKDSFDRKPNCGMGYKAAMDSEICLKNSVMVGDASDAKVNFSDSDRKFAENCGMQYYDIKEFLKQ
jgi:DNA 3'-phosphatase